MDRAQTLRMELRINRLSSPTKEHLAERLRTVLEDELRLQNDVKIAFIAQHGGDEWNQTLPTDIRA